MLSGNVTAQLEPSLAIEVRGPKGGRVVSVAVDTGFNGELALPRRVVESLGLEFSSHTLAQLADGSVLPLPKFRAQVILGDRPHPVLVLESEGGPLLGMGLLENHVLRIEAWEGGDVRVEARSG